MTETLAMADANCSSAKTIEFLRARLLAERAASKVAKQQAQELAVKVQDLDVRLESEIEHRRKAEEAIRKLFSVLKTRGVTMGSVPLENVELKGEPTGTIPPSDPDEEGKEVCIEVSGHETELQIPGGNENESSTPRHSLQVHGNLSVVENMLDMHVSGNPLGISNPAERRVYLSLMASADHDHASADEVQGADHAKDTAQSNHSVSDGETVIKEELMGEESVQHGLCVASELKAIEQQMGEGAGCLPKVLQLPRLNCQGANESHSGREAVTLEIDVSKQPDVLMPSTRGGNVPEIKRADYTNAPVQSKNLNAIHLNEAGRHSSNEMNNMATEVSTPGLVRSLFPVFKPQFQQRDLMGSTSSLTTPTIEGSSMHSHLFLVDRQSYSEPKTGWNRNIDANVGSFPGQKPFYGSPNYHLPCVCNIQWGDKTRTTTHVGQDLGHLGEVPSPNISDTCSLEDMLDYTYGQHDEFWSPDSLPSGVEWPNPWFPTRIAHSPTMYSNDCFINDMITRPRDSLTKQEKDCSHPNMHPRSSLQGAYNNMHSSKGRDLRKSFVKERGRNQSKLCFGFNNAAQTVHDGSSETLGGILLAMDAALQHREHKQLMEPIVPIAAGSWHKGGYLFGDSVSQLCHDPKYYKFRQSHCPVPLRGFLSSPSVEHGHWLSRKPTCGLPSASNCDFSNFTMPEWGDKSQGRGREVHLSNGITLYTD